MTDKPYYVNNSLISIDQKKVKDYSWIVFAFLVLFLHALLPWISSFSNPPPKKLPKQKVIVQTIKLNQGIASTSLVSLEEAPVVLAPLPPPEPVSAPLPPQIEKKKVEPPKPKPLPKIEKKAPAPAKKAPEKKKEVKPIPPPVVKKKPPEPKVHNPKEDEAKKKIEQNKKDAEQKLKKEQEVKKKIAEQEAAEKAARNKAVAAIVQENLAKNKESRDKISTTQALDLNKTSIPTTIAHLQIDALPTDQDDGIKWSAKEVSYRDEVAQRLKATLRLPDYGAVKIELTISKTGKVEKIKIISSESAKNKQYIERMLPTLQFPSFGNRFQDAPQCSFSITLNNETKN